jgi:two-component system chemotaxis response regulator CheB
MDGLTFLEKLMRLHPMPVLMVSTLTENGADTTLRALELGAIDYVSKPKIDIAHTLEDYAAELVEKVKTVARARVRARLHEVPDSIQVMPRFSADAVLARQEGEPGHFKTTDTLIAIGASTGGTEAIKEVLMAMPPDAPGTVITQHIPEAFSGPFAERMNGISRMIVCEAENGQQILAGHAYIAPGHSHLMVARDGARFVCVINDGPPVNRHKPSVDVLFRSVAQNLGHNAVGVILTGMGDDGAEGLHEMRDAGAFTIAQDEETSVVWGMPGEAVKRGGVDKVVPLGQVAKHVLGAVAKKNN